MKANHVIYHVIYMDKETALDAYLDKVFTYALSETHTATVRVTGVSLYGGVVLCSVKVLSAQPDKRYADKTDYKAMEKENVLAGRLVPERGESC